MSGLCAGRVHPRPDSTDVVRRPADTVAHAVAHSGAHAIADAIADTRTNAEPNTRTDATPFSLQLCAGLRRWAVLRHHGEP